MARINLQKIVSVKGQPGLFHLLSYNTHGYFLQPFSGGQTRFFSNARDKVLAVGNVDLKLKEGSINSLEIFRKMEKEEVPLNSDSNDKIGVFFYQLLPDLDREVAFPHLRKVLKWYHLILEHFQDPELVNEEDDGLSIV